MQIQHISTISSKLSLTLILAASLSACLSNPSKPKAENPSPVAEQEAPPIKPNAPANNNNPGGQADTTPELEALNLPAPKAGGFLQANFEHKVEDAPIVRIQNNTIKYDFDTAGTATKPQMTGFRQAFYDENGNLFAISMGNSKFIVGNASYNKIFANKLNSTNAFKLFSLKTAADSTKHTFEDAGIKEGGNKAGIYIDHNQTYVWRDPAVAGWNYQTFGFFNKQTVKGYDSSTGFQSIGVGTTTAQLPTKGKATYNGYATGLYQASGKTYDAISDVKVDVNFAKRKVDFVSINTKTYERTYTGEKYTLKAAQSAQQLNLKATANFNTGATKFSTTQVEVFADSDLKGRLDGRFYGDKAAEVGGTFGLGGGGKTYIGGFGAKRK